MKVVKKELKEVFEPFKLEVMFESKREVEVFFAFLQLSYREVNEINNSSDLVISDITYKEDSIVIAPVYSTLLRNVLKK